MYPYEFRHALHSLLQRWLVSAHFSGNHQTCVYQNPWKKLYKLFFFYIHGSVHRESNLIIVQQDATVFSLLYFCRQLHMFRVLTPIIRRAYNCNYSFWHWSAGFTTIRCRWVGTTPIIRSSYNCNYSFWHWSTGSTTIRSCWVGTTPIIRSTYNCNYSFWHWSTGSTNSCMSSW